MAMKFGDKLKRIRLEKGLSQENLADLLGTSKQVISRYERNERTPKLTSAIEYAQKLNVPTNFLLDNENDAIFSIPGVLPLPHMTKKPLIGTIACGTPIMAEQNIEDYISCPDDIHADFCLRCKGDSMVNARIYDGDIVFVHKQPEVENGEIAAVQIMDGGDCEATLKRVYMEGNKLTLMPENPKYPPLVYVGEELNNIKVAGKAVYFVSEVR